MKTHQPWRESANEKIYFMNMLHDKPGSGICPAPNGIKPVNFQCFAPEAKIVQLSGNFNHWHPILMRQRKNDRWFIQIWLPQGYHQYRFLVDGKPTLDLHATGATRDEQDELVSLIAVS
jgi:1,4-alpha-glucan branching enzyme